MKILVPSVGKTNFKMERIDREGYDSMMESQVRILIPTSDDLKTADEVAADIYGAAMDSDRERIYCDRQSGQRFCMPGAGNSTARASAAG